MICDICTDEVTHCDGCDDGVFKIGDKIICTNTEHFESLVCLLRTWDVEYFEGEVKK